MDDIRSWWEVPCVAHYCHIFRKPFKLPEFEIEELEDALLLDYSPSPSSLLVELYCLFLNGIVDKPISDENWEFFLKLHLEWRCEFLGERWNPLGGEREYRDLSTREKVEILHRLCHWRLELDDIGDMLRGVDGPSLRLEPMGRDADGYTYWYFYGTRLYKEAPKRRRRAKKEEGATPQSKKNETPSGRGRGRGRGRGGGRNTPGRRKKEETESNDSGVESVRGRKRGRRGREEEDEDSGNRRASRGRGRGRGAGAEPSSSSESSGEESSQEKDEQDKKSPSKQQKGSGGESEGGDGEEVAENGEKESVKDSPPLPSVKTGWFVVCSTEEEWEGLVEALEEVRHPEARRLYRALSEELWPEVQRELTVKERQFKRKLLAELPRRTSDRIALKAQQKAEQERMDALEREQQREELRRELAEEAKQKEEEAEQKRQRRREEAIRRRKEREEQQQRIRSEEDENWSKALSGELSGPRRAAIGAAEQVSEGQLSHEWVEIISAERDQELYTAMFKILSGLRKHEDGWVFEEPVTEAIAPGYFDVVKSPMDFVTVEKKLESSQYKTREQFDEDMNLIFDNCVEYNGADSEYAELAEEMKKMFQQLSKKHFAGEEEEPVKKRKKRESRSPSACKTPELTSESSEEESDSGSDTSYNAGRAAKKAVAKDRVLSLGPELERRLHPSLSQHPHHPATLPHHAHPQFYAQYMRQHPQYGMRPPMPPEMAYRHHYARMPPPYATHPMHRPEGMYPLYPPPNHFPQHPMSPYRYPVPPHMPPHMMQQHPPRVPSPAAMQRASPSPVMAPTGNPLIAQRQTASPSQRQTASPSQRQTASPSQRQTASPSQRQMASPSQRPTDQEKEEEAESKASKTEGEGSEVKLSEKERQLPVKGGHPQMPPGYAGPGRSYEMGRHAAYRYHQMMAMQGRQPHHPADPYARYPHPHGMEHYPPYPPHPSHPSHPSQEEAYYAWQQQQAMYARHASATPPEMVGGQYGHAQMEAARQRYWHEMEMRRRHHYALMQQQQQRLHGNMQQPLQPRKEQGSEASVSTEGKAGEAPNPIPKDALAPGGEERRESEKQPIGNTQQTSDSLEKETQSGDSPHIPAKLHGGGDSPHTPALPPDGGDSPHTPALPPDGGDSPHTLARATDQSLTSSDQPQPRALHRPPPPYPTHSPMHLAMQNGYLGEAEAARMHPSYPPHPHMLSPHTVYSPPPYASRQFPPAPPMDPEHRNGLPPPGHIHPSYAGYYGNRMPYYPHPYMHDHAGAMGPEQLERWQVEEMKRQQAMHAHHMHSYSPHSYPHMPHPHHHTNAPLHTHTQGPHQSPPAEVEEPPAKKQRTS